MKNKVITPNASARENLFLVGGGERSLRSEIGARAVINNLNRIIVGAVENEFPEIGHRQTSRGTRKLGPKVRPNLTIIQSKKFCSTYSISGLNHFQFTAYYIKSVHLGAVIF